MAQTSPRDSVRVLVVDDNESIRDSTADILRTAGYSAYMAADPGEALALLRAQSVDLVIVDLGLDFDGVRFLSQLSRPPPVIVISGNQDRRRTPRGPILLTKPISPGRLLAEVARQLGGATLV